MRIPDYAARIKFHDAQDILEVDFSDVTFRDTEGCGPILR